MAKMGRPVVYTDDAERPETISVRVPKELYDRVKRYAYEHRQSLTELVKDGLEWRITDGDPRAPIVLKEDTYDKSVIQELARAVMDELGRMPLEDVSTRAEPPVTTAPTNGITVIHSPAQAFDATRYELGELCVHGHAWGDSGQSLRRISDGECMECRRVRNRAYKQRVGTGKVD